MQRRAAPAAPAASGSRRVQSWLSVSLILTVRQSMGELICHVAWAAGEGRTCCSRSTTAHYAPGNDKAMQLRRSSARWRGLLAEAGQVHSTCCSKLYGASVPAD